MSTRQFLEMDANGIAEYLHFDDNGELQAIEWVDDVEVILDHNKGLQNDGTGGWTPSREWKRIGSVPLSLLKTWEIEMGLPMDFLQTKEGMPILLKKIKDPDYKHLRTDK